MGAHRDTRSGILEVRRRFWFAIATLIWAACAGAPVTGTGAAPTPPVALAIQPPGIASISPAPAAQSAGGSDWTVYHQDPTHRGIGPSTPNLGAAQVIWTASLDGEVYGEPLAIGQTVLVVTENDTVYALDAASGGTIWSQHLGDPVPLSELPCGNIDPSGLTATPVIDPSTGVLYVVGRVEPTHHELVALDIASGAVLFRETIDPQGADPRYLQERGALALANGEVYVPFGGNLGDCGPYTGWVIAAAADGSGITNTYSVPTQREAAIWAPSGMPVDADGTLLVATGNGASFNSSNFDYGNAVIRLSADLQVLDYWAPSDWASLSRTDTDIGSIGPALLDNDQVFQTGKNGEGYLLRASQLGGIGGELFSSKICDASFGGTAFQSPFVYVPCTDQLVALNTTSGSFSVAWRVMQSGLYAPILAYGSLWTINGGAAELLQIDPTSGTVVGHYPLGGPIVAHFVTPTATNGLIIAPSGHGVTAFGAGSS